MDVPRAQVALGTEVKMALVRWEPVKETNARERFLLGRLKRTGRLFAFLRMHRHELFNGVFQDEFAGMYRSTGEGKEPVAPAMLAMVVLLQAYTGSSDAEAVELSIVDARWQLVLGRLGHTKPAFSQGALQAFRERLIAHDMDRRLLERTVELAKVTRAFDWKKLPRELRVAVDSRPLEGAGRVEDTINLLAHAARKLITCAAALADIKPAELAKKAGAPILAGRSVKAALDLEWSDPSQKDGAIVTLLEQIDSLERWLRHKLPDEIEEPPLSDLLATLAQLRAQDLDPEPPGGKPRIREGVAKDRRVSVEDADMRHGRKSSSKRFNGFKSHVAADLDTELILACAVMPANRPEEEGIAPLRDDLALAGHHVSALFIDRGYIASSEVQQMAARGGTIMCKPWVPRNGRFFPKSAFQIDVKRRLITCPAGHPKSFQLGTKVEFDAALCNACSMRSACTPKSAADRGRTVRIAADEPLQQELRRVIASPAGREQLRKRVAVEHLLAHVARKQGHRARYRGTRKNLFDARRYSAVINLETLQRAKGAHESRALRDAA